MVPPVPLHGPGGISGLEDLPVPWTFVVVGLVLTVAVTVAAARSSRAPAEAPPRPAPELLARVVDSPGWARTWRALGLGFFGYLVWPLVRGPDLVDNPVIGTWQVLVWVGLVPLSLLLGPVVRAVSPVRTVNLLLARLLRSDPATGVTTYPERWGAWPAALLLLAVSWQQLVDPRSGYLDSVRTWLTAYVAIMLVGAAVFGDTWLARADPFEVWSDLVARLSPWGRDDEGRLVLRGPVRGLDTLPVLPGVPAVVAVALGAAAYDVLAPPSTTPVPGTLLLLAACAVAGASLARLGPAGAPALVPVAVALVLSRHLTYLVEQGQATLLDLADPLVRGDDLLGTGSWSVSYALSARPDLVAGLGVVALLAGHVVGTRAARVRRRREPVLLVLAWTVAGLVLLGLG